MKYQNEKTGSNWNKEVPKKEEKEKEVEPEKPKHQLLEAPSHFNHAHRGANDNLRFTNP